MGRRTNNWLDVPRELVRLAGVGGVLCAGQVQGGDA